MVARRLIVHGLVQGVGFRYWLARAAEMRGVTGWVRNRADGTVEAFVEGPADALASLVRACEAGPRGASVERIEASDAEPSGATGFSVR